MKLIHAVRNVDRSPQNTHSVSVEPFAEIFDMQISWVPGFGDRVKQHFIKLWICTDAWVGLSAFYFDDIPVAIGRQPSRGRPLVIQFLSEESAEMVRSFIKSLFPEDERAPAYPIFDENEDIGESYSLEYSSNILRFEAMHNGEPVTISRNGKHGYLIETVDVVTAGGNSYSAKVSELEFSLMVRKVPDAIEVEHEDVEDLKTFGLGLANLQESCVFCASPTRYWHAPTNTPCCEGCAPVHTVPELLSAKAAQLKAS